MNLFIHRPFTIANNTGGSKVNNNNPIPSVPTSMDLIFTMDDVKLNDLFVLL